MAIVNKNEIDNRLVTEFKHKMDDIEYPPYYDLISGLKDGIKFAYISNTYLNGFINYVDIIGANMIYRYSSDEEWENACKYLDEYDIKDHPHTNFSYDCRLDDILIISTVDNSYTRLYNKIAYIDNGEEIREDGTEGFTYVYFWFDNDVSDCCIGRFSFGIKNNEGKYDKKLSDEHIIKIFDEFCLDRSKDLRGKAMMYKIPLEYFIGWIKI